MADKTQKLIKAMKEATPKVTPIATDMVLPNHSGIASHPEAEKVFIKSEQGDQGGKIDSEYTSGSGVRFNFGTKTDLDLWMEIGAYLGTNNIDTKNRNFKIFSTAQADIFEVNATTGTATFNFAPTITPFSSAGFIKNDTSGVLSGGNAIDISADTNLTVTSPITLTGDDIGLDKTATYDWSGVHEFQTNTKLQFRDTEIFIHSNTDGEMTIEADVLVTIGAAGDIELGDGTLRDLKPNTDGKMNLGNSSKHFASLFLHSFTDATRGAAGNAGRVIFNTNDGNLNIDNGTNWILPNGTVT